MLDILQLPNETWHEIVTYLEIGSHKDVHNLRLTCRRAAAIGLEHILPILHVNISTSSLHRLQKISRNAVLSKSLKELWLYPDILVEHRHFDIWWNTLGSEHEIVIGYHSSPSSGTGLADGFTSLNRKQHVKAYCQYDMYLAEQKTLLQRHVVEDVFHRAVCKLSVLKTLGMKSLCHEMILGNVGTDALGAFPFKLPCGTFTLLRQVNQTAYHRPSVRMLRSALNNLAPTVRLTELSIGGLLWTEVCTDAFMGKIWPILSGLRSFSIVDPELQPYRPRSMVQTFEENRAMHNRILPQVLKQARNIEELQMWTPWAPDDINKAMTMEEMFGFAIWPRLRKLDLLSVLIQEASFLEFLQHHRHCLKELTLQFPFLDGADPRWDVLCNKIKKIVDLESFSLVDSHELDESMGLVNPEIEEAGDILMWRYHPNRLSIARALRFLVCGKRTDYAGRTDTVASFSDEIWAKVTWEAVRRAL